VESLLAALKALGAPLASLNDVSGAIRERELTKYRRVLEPVHVAWQQEKPEITFNLPIELAEALYSGRLELESGEKFEWEWAGGNIQVVAGAVAEKQKFVTKKLAIPRDLSYGYHKFTLEIKRKAWQTLLIAAPRRAFSPSNVDERGWGAFLPLYALKSQHDWGSGDYSGLGEMARWVADQGGNTIATLPLLPVFLDKPYDPSPYAPVSRLLWNEFYADVTKVPEFLQSAEARAIAQSDSFTAEINRLKAQPLVDYRRVMSLKRKVMEVMYRCLAERGGERLQEFRRFASNNPVAEDYARFRAALEKQSGPLHNRVLQETDYDVDVKDYHLYAQWLAQQQVGQLAENARNKDVKLYFDLPLGVHPDGYDAWRYRELFAEGVRAGAPPDPVFTTGQDWGFPPLHPEKIRELGYQYVRDYLHHHMKYAQMLRIDHVMGLHRLYWIPRGIEASQGVYVRYPADELYAVLALESHRHKSVIVGEDLGIVPGYIRPAMARHGLHRMYILYYELADSALRTPRPVPHNCVAGLNTHDMPPFAAFWEGKDIGEKEGLGIQSRNEAESEKAARASTVSALKDYLLAGGFLKETSEDTRAALKAWLVFLNASNAHTVLINLEDLWLETQSQNIPGAGEKFAAWRRKARYALEEFCRLSEVSDILGEINKSRKR
jgi:4-alpha-glucanotransferase